MAKKLTISELVDSRVEMAKEQDKNIDKIMEMLKQIIPFKKIGVSHIEHSEGRPGYVIFECENVDDNIFFFEIKQNIDDVITSVRPINDGVCIPYARRLNSDNEKKVLDYFLNNYQAFSLGDMVITDDNNGYALLIGYQYDDFKLRKLKIAYQSHDISYSIITYIDTNYHARSFGFDDIYQDCRQFMNDTPIRFGSKKIEFK